MENSSEQIPPQEEAQTQEQTQTGTNPLNVGFALVVAFALGLALGFFGRPKIIEDVPVQVVVTVVPNDSGEEVAQATTANAESTGNADSTYTTGTMDTNNSSASGSTNQAGTSAGSAADTANPSASEQGDASTAQPTPTIMEFVMSDARHWQGDEAAPVTIVEFSDFK